MNLYEQALGRFQELLEEAKKIGLREPKATTLATADERGQPSVRTVFLETVDEHGFVFFTDQRSRKAHHLGHKQMSDYTSHWDHIYNTKAPGELGWYQAHLSTSLELILQTGISRESHIIDVGGGNSTLVDDLLAQGFRHITVLDISAQALTMAKARLGKKAGDIEWIIADIRHADLPHHAYDVWHDRALFHFLTDAEDRRRYLDVLRHALKPEGYLIIATFALDAPPRCSGLEVVRYDPQGLEAEFGDEFKLIQTRREVHQTPSGIQQPYNFCLFRRVQ